MLQAAGQATPMTDSGRVAGALDAVPRVADIAVACGGYQRPRPMDKSGFCRSARRSIRVDSSRAALHAARGKAWTANCDKVLLATGPRREEPPRF